MSRICKECPIAQLCDSDISRYQDGFQNGLFLQVIQGLSGQMRGFVEGTRAGLTGRRIETIRQDEVKKWGAASEEGAYLEANPGLAQAVHDCELTIQLGNCVIHSVQSINS